MNFPCDMCGYPTRAKQEAYIRKLLGSQDITLSELEDTGETVVVETSVEVDWGDEVQHIQVFL